MLRYDVDCIHTTPLLSATNAPIVMLAAVLLRAVHSSENVMYFLHSTFSHVCSTHAAQPSHDTLSRHWDQYLQYIRVCQSENKHMLQRVHEWSVVTFLWRL